MMTTLDVGGTSVRLGHCTFLKPQTHEATGTISIVGASVTPYKTVYIYRRKSWVTNTQIQDKPFL